MNKKIKIYNEIKDKLTQQEKDAINAMFVIDDRYPKNLDEFQEKYKINYEDTREILRNLLGKYEAQIKKLQYSTHIFISDNIWIKPDDIIEITIDRMYYSEPENEDEPIIYDNNITYNYNGKELSTYNFDEEEDYCLNIKDFVAENLKQDLGITDYEIFDIQGDFLCESAKIRVKSIE